MTDIGGVGSEDEEAPVPSAVRGDSAAFAIGDDDGGEQ